MAKTETETKITLDKTEVKDLKAAIEKLTEKQIGFNKANLSDS